MNRRTMAKSKTKYFFVWTNDEVELLLKVTHEYKALKWRETYEVCFLPEKGHMIGA